MINLLLASTIAYFFYFSFTYYYMGKAHFGLAELRKNEVF